MPRGLQGTDRYRAGTWDCMNEELEDTDAFDGLLAT